MFVLVILVTLFPFCKLRINRSGVGANSGLCGQALPSDGRLHRQVKSPPCSRPCLLEENSSGHKKGRYKTRHPPEYSRFQTRCDTGALVKLAFDFLILMFSNAVSSPKRQTERIHIFASTVFPPNRRSLTRTLVTIEFCQRTCHVPTLPLAFFPSFFASDPPVLLSCSSINNFRSSADMSFGMVTLIVT